MNIEQKYRLKELKAKYLWKYVIWPGMIEFSKSFPFNLEDLKNSALLLRGYNGQRNQR